MIKIYNFARGARGLRAIWQCEEMGLPYRLQTISFPTSEDYRAVNPLGTVPFLEDDGGVAINESTAMMLYLAQRYGPTPLLPGNDNPLLARVLQMTVFGEATIGQDSTLCWRRTSWRRRRTSGTGRCAGRSSASGRPSGTSPTCSGATHFSPATA
jgi:glutathione S-transferase